MTTTLTDHAAEVLRQLDDGETTAHRFADAVQERDRDVVLVDDYGLAVVYDPDPRFPSTPYREVDAPPIPEGEARRFDRQWFLSPLRVVEVAR